MNNIFLLLHCKLFHTDIPDEEKMKCYELILMLF